MQKRIIRMGIYFPLLFMVMFIYGCGHTADKEAHIEREPEEFHADNDIAMTLRSLTDALKVGESLDSAEYDYEGVLTDGQGHPLYTDIQGNPGEWKVDVISPAVVVIRNMYLGDLLPTDLRIYLEGSLGLSDNDIVRNEMKGEGEVELIIYDFGGGFLKFETRTAMASNGLEGPLMRITASREYPSEPT